jgi:hypothetical protein
MLEFQMAVSRWSFVVRQRPFLACPERSEGTGDQRRSATISCYPEENF